MGARILLLVTVGLVMITGAAEPMLEWKYETTGKIYASPLIADLEDDGHMEVVVAASRDRKLLCLDGQGQLRWSVEIADGNTDGLQATPSVGDYDGDGLKEVFVASKGGTVACIEHDGDVRWKTSLHDLVDYTAPVLADINADGHIEILLGSESGTLYCLDDTGAPLWHYQGQGAIRGIPAIGRDPRGATLRVYAVFSGGMLGCFDSEGNLVWKQDEPGPRSERRSGVAIGDLDGDGREEVVSATEDFAVIVADAATGEERWRWKGAHAIDQTCSFALADMDGSGKLDILCGDGLGLSQPGNVYRLRDGKALWTADAGGGVLQGPSVADVDGDGRLDVLVCSRSQNLIGLGDDGLQKWSFPTEAGCLTTPAVGDVDGDDQVEIVFTSKDRFIYCVSVGGACDPETLPWPNINGDLQLTGNAKPFAFAPRWPDIPQSVNEPLIIEHNFRDDLSTIDVTVHVANTEAWPRRLELSLDSKHSEQNFTYTQHLALGPFETGEARIPMQVLYDGQRPLDVRLRDAGTQREIAARSGAISVNPERRVRDWREGMRNLYRTVVSRGLETLRDRATPEYDAISQALTEALGALASTDSAPPVERVNALTQAAAAVHSAKGFCARAAAIARLAPTRGLDFAAVTDTSLRKVFRDEPFQGGASEMHIALARNESEAFQVVVVPLWKDLQDVTVTAEVPAESYPDQHVPTCTIAPVGYITIGTPEYSFPVEKLGDWPDVLMPDAPIDIPATQEAQPFWITVTTTADTTPAFFRGVIRVTAKDCSPIELPLEIRVWDFTLPQETTLKTSFWINENYIARFYGYEGRLPWEVRKRWYDFHLARRVSPIKDFPLGGGDTIDDFDYLMANGQNVFFVPVPHVSDRSKWPNIAEQFTTTHDRLESKGWNDKALLYSWDEVAVVGRHDIPEFVEMNAWLKDAAPWWPRLETSAPEQALLGSVDIWCPTIDNFDPVLLADRKTQGERLWFYTVWGRPGIMIEFPATDHRLMFWECWKYGAEGFLYWGTTHWDLNLQTDARWPDIPWIPWNRQPGHNGCGYLLYPGPNGEPLSSIRLELVRDGIEDYEYFHLLETLVERAGDALPEPLRERATTLLAVDPDVVVDHQSYTEDPEVLAAARREIAQTILDLQRCAVRN